MTESIILCFLSNLCGNIVFLVILLCEHLCLFLRGYFKTFLSVLYYLLMLDLQNKLGNIINKAHAMLHLESCQNNF